jgi:hypothetical protein
MVVLQEESRGFSVGEDGRGVEIEKLFIQVSKKVLLGLIKQLGVPRGEMTRLNRMTKDGVAHYLMRKFATDERGAHPGMMIDTRTKPRSKAKTLLDRKIEASPPKVPKPSYVKKYVRDTTAPPYISGLPDDFVVPYISGLPNRSPSRSTVKPRQRGGFFGALARIALPIVAEQFVQHRLDNPDSNIGPNRITEVNMLGDASRGKFTNQGLMSLGRR